MPAARMIVPKIRDSNFSSPVTPFHKTIFTKKRAFFLSTRNPVNSKKSPIKTMIMVSIIDRLHDCDTNLIYLMAIPIV